MSTQKFLIIDEHGDLFSPDAETKIISPEIIQEFLKNLKLSTTSVLQTQLDDDAYIVEAFDHPLMIQKIEVHSGKVLVEAQYQILFEADIHKFSVDDQDRFCGLTITGAPFRLTEKAQEKLFSACDEYDDDSFTLNQLRIETPPYYLKNSDIQKSDYWQDVYKTEGKPGWDLQQPAETFKDMIQRVKFPKSRVLVLGCGEGHDAALFAEAGHIVTAVDFSIEGIQRGREKYKDLKNLTFVQENIFNLPQDWNFSFDVIIEHTCFCAIPTDQRKKLIAVWRRLLHEEGQLMATFFTMLKRAGPPYGATELELRELLAPHFHFLFWGRWRQSLIQRQGKELFVLAKKI
jgi:SAM-dependent methyltransferase